MSDTHLTLDAELRAHDPDRWLSSRYVADEAARAQLVALYTLDGEWGRVAVLAKTPLAGEIRLAWWRDTLERFANGGPAEHPALAALGAGTARTLHSELQTAIEARHADLEQSGPNEATTAAIMAASARLLDMASPAEAVRAAAHAWTTSHLHALRTANAELVALPENAFPAVAHVTLVRIGERQAGELEKRARITWAVLRGRL